MGRGITEIKGKTRLQLGETAYYEVSRAYKEDHENLKNTLWKLYVKENGKWRELVPDPKVPVKKGRRVPLKVTNPRWLGKELLLEAYLYTPEKKAPPGLVITIQKGKPEILHLRLRDANGDKFKEKPKYGQTLTAIIEAVNMEGEKLAVSLWERDTYSDTGHDTEDNQKLWSKEDLIVEKNGIVKVKIPLTLDMKNKAANNWSDMGMFAEHEYYLLVQSTIATDKYSIQTVEVKNEIVKVQGVGIDPPPETGNSPQTVAMEGIENVTDAYFAKREYSKETTEIVGSYTYTFKYTNNNIDKEKISSIIQQKISSSLKIEKKYAKQETIKKSLAKDTYNKGETISFKVYKLGASYKKMNAAPFGENLYLVAKTIGLDGQQATITIKEKDGMIGGQADAALSVLQIANEKDKGTEKTAFKATIKDGEIAIPIRLRPASDDTLEEWQEKVQKGAKEGIYTYIANNPFTVEDEKEREVIANNIAKNTNAKDEIKSKNLKVYAEDIIKLLTVKKYYSRVENIPTYKKAQEQLYLNVQTQKEEQHNDNFLKKDGSYFTVGGKCSCNRNLTEIEFRQILKHLRESEKLDTSNIWEPRKKGGAKPSDISLASTVNKLNDVFRKFEINSCIRKVYFLAECYHETDRFYSTQEYDNSYTSGYDPLRGRGLIQLTGSDSYTGYSKYRGEDFVGDYQKIATDLFNAFDASGWFWTQGKRLNSGDRWRGYPRVKVNYNGYKYTSINLNSLADKDDAANISYLINGGDNGLTERRKYLKKLKKLPVFVCDKNSKGNDQWHDPVDNPMSTNFYQNGNFDDVSKIWGLFGNDIRKEVGRKHTGLDLFATTGTNIYACVDGTVYNRRWHSGYGNTITIKVTNPKAFLERKRNDYTRKTSREMKHGNDWNENGDIYLFYAHLDSVKKFDYGDKVECGDILGTTGRSGVMAGTHAPHLHFEIFCSYVMATGTKYRMNPAYFIDYKYYDEQNAAERQKQQKEKDRGQIKEKYGKEKLSTSNIF